MNAARPGEQLDGDSVTMVYENAVRDETGYSSQRGDVTGGFPRQSSEAVKIRPTTNRFSSSSEEGDFDTSNELNNLINRQRQAEFNADQIISDGHERSRDHTRCEHGELVLPSTSHEPAQVQTSMTSSSAYSRRES